MSSRHHRRPMNSSTSRLPLLRRISLLFSLATLSFYVGFHSTPPATNDRDLIDLQQLLHRCGSASNSTHLASKSKPPTILTGAARVPKDELMKRFSFGVPLLDRPTGQDALLLFQSSEACPGDKCPDAEMSPPLIANVTDALENCDTLNVQWTHNPTPTTLCQVYIPQDGLPTYHVSRWLRLAAEGPLDRSKNLRHVAVMTNPRGINRHNVPRMPLIRKHWQSLLIFLEHLDDVLDDVRKIIDERLAKLTAISNRHQPIIAMTVNKGQSQLLANFLCAARSKNLDVSRILVFVTDAESEAIVRNLISDDHSSPMVYFDRYNFESVPLGGDNETYGDATFTAMMWVKILSVLYISLLGHDIMFQDVDIVWEDDPLPLFYCDDLVRYDAIFQHDGSTESRYKPYSANTGFYFLRANERTHYLLVSLLYNGDIVKKTTSHQQTINQLLLEHSSMFGLKVKTLDRHEEIGRLFPGGFQYKQDHDAIRRILNGEVKPKLFHMVRRKPHVDECWFGLAHRISSQYWTPGFKEKVQFMKQFGMWYLTGECMGDEMSALMSNCCSKKPLVTCFFRDKPSVINCNGSPLFDKNAKPFWVE